MPGSERLEALTGLRFVAASLIMAHHISYLGVPQLHFRTGQGVSIFFVLSGFILAYVHPTMDGWRQGGRFLVNRFARIWPAHAVTLLAAIVVLNQPVTNYTWTNLLLLHSWVPSSDYYFSHNQVSWSVSTELGFYLMFPLLIYKWRSTYIWKIALTVVLAVAIIRTTDYLQLGRYSLEPKVTGHGLIYINPATRLLEFVVGIASCSAYRWLAPRMPSKGMIFSYLEIASVGLFVVAAVGKPEQWLYPITSTGFREWLAGSSCLPAAAAMIIVFAFGRGDISTVLKTKVFIFLGEISYSLYLCHMIVFQYFYWNLRAPEVTLLSVAVPIAVSIACAAILWRYVEVPITKSVKAIGRKPAPPPEAVTSPTLVAAA